MRLPFGAKALALALLLTACQGGEANKSGQVEAQQVQKDASAVESTPWPDPANPGLGEGDPILIARLKKAWVAKGADYKPRTHHLEADGSPTFTNRLIEENSPYLLQHAHNPVNWHPWGPEAFARAKAEGKPILLSIGYSTCHWCHVMEKESFEDLEIAQYMNENYIAIKVDREERPDLDAVYMSAVKLLTGRGGWPMTTMLTPDRQPFFGGTYFPPRDGVRRARKGFLTILKEMKLEYDTDPEGVVAKAAELSERIQKSAKRSRPGDVPGTGAIVKTVGHLARQFDVVNGGFGSAPKFPRPVTLELLLRYHRRTGDREVLKIVEHTLKKMANGGMYDQVGGGFHRYATDAKWLVPHFEKMLYDNAQLTMIYLDAYQATSDPFYARIARQTLDYIAREMTDPQGGFYSATDADSPVPGKHEEEEGWYFTWTPQEIDAVLNPKQAKVVKALYGVTQRGNFEGRNILNIAQDWGDVAKKVGMKPKAFRKTLDEARGILLTTRAKRPPPLRDGKILASWNGLMISAFARGALVFGDEGYNKTAQNAADFMLTHMRDGSLGLKRSYQGFVSKQGGFLDDYAFVIQGLLDVFEATGDTRWLNEALSLQAKQDEQFWDGAAGAYFFTQEGSTELLIREKPDYDGAEPSGNSIAFSNLLRLSLLTENEAFKVKAEKGFGYFSTLLDKRGLSVPRMLSALDFYLDTPLEVFLVAPEGEAVSEPMMDVVRGSYLPNRVFIAHAMGADFQTIEKRVPLIKGKVASKGKTTAYVCEEGLCKLPTTDPAVLKRQLGKAEPLLVNGQAPHPTQSLEEAATHKPWEYNKKTNKHWDPKHRHWHDGPPPQK